MDIVRKFIQNIDTGKSKERLTPEEQGLAELKKTSINEKENYMGMESNENNSEFVNQSFESNFQNNNVDDLKLDTPRASYNKKYIILGFGLVLLFIIIVLIIRLISNSDTQNQYEIVNPLKSEVSQEGLLNKIDSSEEVQEDIDIKNTLDESKFIMEMPQKSNNVPLVLDTPEVEVEEALKKASKVETRILSTPKRKIVVFSPQETNFAKKANVIKGYFIQIGAFTKEPNKNLLKSIGTKGYKYKVQQIKINGKIYNKVLIGSFETRAEATIKLNQVKLDFKNPNAYILKF
ncbi:SPOR domain-containing protein [Arcobacteraceae bacterium]|nr:SPOR domain-containing protein [Arcobacteraceae bacterium]